MKKMFLAVLTSLALCSYGFAQDDEEEYEEDEAPAKVVKKAAVEEEEEEEEAEEAPAKKAEKKKAAKKSSSNEFFGVGIDIGGLLNDEGNIRLAFNITDRISVTGILGFMHHGAVTIKDKASGNEATGDGSTDLAIGAGIDFKVVEAILPVVVGGEFLIGLPAAAAGDAGSGNDYNDWGEDDDFGAAGGSGESDTFILKINGLVGANAPIASGLYLTGKVGLGITYESTENDAIENSHVDIGLVTKVYLTWYMF